MRGKLYRRVGRPDPIVSFSADYVEDQPQFPQVLVSSVEWPSSEYGALDQLHIQFVRPDGIITTQVSIAPFVYASIGLNTPMANSPALASPSGNWQIRLAVTASTSPLSEYSSFQSFNVP